MNAERARQLVRQTILQSRETDVKNVRLERMLGEVVRGAYREGVADAIEEVVRFHRQQPHPYIVDDILAALRKLK